MVTSLDFEDIVEKLYVQFKDNWDYNAIPMQGTNVQKATGASGKDLTSLTEFVRFQVFMPDVVQNEMSTGNIRKRINGFVNVTHFAKSGRGDRLSYRALDDAKAIFENPNTLDGIVFRPASINTIGEIEGYFQLVLTIPFYVDTEA